MTKAVPKNLNQLKAIWESAKEPLDDDSLEAAIQIIEKKVKDSVSRDGHCGHASVCD
ncbi:MAG: hypothetical protein AAF487_11900 [Bacteroidota bacterium]